MVAAIRAALTCSENSIDINGTEQYGSEVDWCIKGTEFIGIGALHENEQDHGRFLTQDDTCSVGRK